MNDTQTTYSIGKTHLRVLLSPYGTNGDAVFAAPEAMWAVDQLRRGAARVRVHAVSVEHLPGYARIVGRRVMVEERSDGMVDAWFLPPSDDEVTVRIIRDPLNGHYGWMTVQRGMLVDMSYADSFDSAAAAIMAAHQHLLDRAAA